MSCFHLLLKSSSSITFIYLLAKLINYIILCDYFGWGSSHGQNVICNPEKEHYQQIWTDILALSFKIKMVAKMNCIVQLPGDINTGRSKLIKRVRINSILFYFKKYNLILEQTIFRVYFKTCKLSFFKYSKF